jgi:hypothetical protein
VNSATATPVTSTDETDRRRAAIEQLERLGGQIITCGGPVEPLTTDLLETVVRHLEEPLEEQQACSAAFVAELDEAEHRPFPDPRLAQRGGWWRRLSDHMHQARKTTVDGHVVPHASASAVGDTW